MLNADPTRPTSNRRRSAPLITVLTLLLAGAIASGCALLARYDTGQGGMDDRAAAVMPFDLDATRHMFTKTDQGGVEEVVVIDPADTRDLDLIRSHLQHEATEFRTGNYSDPAAIHGMDMPGLTELGAGASRIEVRYEEVPGGARITYSSDEPALIDALHAWFDRQTSDHGMPGMGG